jgi:hypothetical protein
MPEQKKRRPVTHKHPAIAAAIHVLKAAGGGPLSAKTIFDRAFDRGLLASTAYNTLRGRLSQHQRVERVVVLKTPEGYMLAPEGVPDDTPVRAVAPSRPPLPEPLRDDPLAVVVTPRPSRRRKPATRARDVLVTPEWLYERGASATVLKWVRLARWRARWREEQGGHPTARDLLTGWLPPDVAAWLVAALPLESSLRAKLKRAMGQSERKRIIDKVENPSRRRRRRADTASAEEATSESTEKEPNGTRAGATER